MSQKEKTGKTLICVMRAAPSVWASLKKLEAESGGAVIVWQGQSKTHKDGPVNPSLFADNDFEDHPGPAPSQEERLRYEALLRDPSNKLRIVNSVAGNRAPSRFLCNQFNVMYADLEYRTAGGVSHIAVDLLYDGDGRDDKVHVVQYNDASGASHQLSEGNAPAGVYAPIALKRAGADEITVFDPHSKKHINNLRKPFGEDNTHIHSNLERITDQIIANHQARIREGKFRIGAPDGWDKKDNPESNAATERVKAVVQRIWDKMPEIHDDYSQDAALFLENVQFGIIKKREARYPGEKAEPVIKGFVGDVTDCDCVLLDDLADSGGSLVKSGKKLIEQGAGGVNAAICHGPARQESFDLILHETTENALNGRTRIVFDKFIVTNSMARVEGIYNGLSDEDKRRTTMINTGDQYIDFLRKTGAAPKLATKSSPSGPPPKPL